MLTKYCQHECCIITTAQDWLPLQLQELGQRSLVAYLRSVFLQPNHEVFDVQKLPAAEYALSIGLPTAPKLRFLKNAGKQVQEVTAFFLLFFFSSFFFFPAMQL